MSYQSNDEILRTFDDWLHNFGPADFINNEENGQALANYIAAKLGGVVTVSNLQRAEQALRSEGRLQLIAPETAEQIRIKQIKEQEDKWRKLHYEALNQKERNFAAEAQAKKAAHDHIKEQAAAEKEIERLISSYSCNHPRLANKVDYAKTAELQKGLKGLEIRDANGKRDAVATLKLVREAISNMP